MAFSNMDNRFEPDLAKKARKFIPIALVAAVTVLGSTLAANINLGSGSLEFGQGILQTTACSGTTSLTMTPKASFVNSAGGGSYYFKSITVANIPLGCQGSDFLINAYDSSTAVSLGLYDSTATDVVVYDSAAGFLVGGGKIGYTVASGSDSFTVTFTTPVATTSSVSRITIQSGIHTVQASEVCGSNGQRSSGGTCRVGDTGSGGGTIFYASATAFTATGSACNTNCHYLEFAPKGWATLSAVPNDYPYNTQVNARSDANIDPIMIYSDGTFAGQSRNTTAVGTAIGTGYQNTQQVKAGTDGAGHDYRYAHTAALAYAGNSGTSTVGEWFLPSLKELNELCKFARGQTNDLGNQSIECSRTGTSLNAAYGFSIQALYMSSTYGLQAAGQVDGYFMDTNNNPMMNLYYANYGNKFRPVRVS